MHNVRSDLSKNRLYITFKGNLDLAEVKAGAAEVVREAKNLRPGFGIVSDISEFSPTNEEGRNEMLIAMQKLKEMGLGHAVRIVKGSVTGYQWQRTSKAAGYSADEVGTLAEAEVLLDKLESL